MRGAAALTILCATATAPALAQTTQVDGIAALVNGEVISIGQVQRAVALMQDPTLGAVAGACGALAGEQHALPAATVGPDPDPPAQDEAERIALECLIDQTLVFREVRRFPELDVPVEAVRLAYDEIVASLDSEQDLGPELQRLGLTADGIRRDLRRQMLIAEYIDSRFRATVDISIEQAEQFWQSTLVPDMLERNIEVPAFEAVAEDFVIPILREREVNRRVQSWISDLRQRADIRRDLARQ